jgi:imidazolonepropionase-like amidohydrolase
MMASGRQHRVLVTNDRPWEGHWWVRDAALVIEAERIAAVMPAGTAAADERIDVGGRCVLPGWVDSHTHLVFAGDRADEFAARMAGRPYEAGGINTTVTATRAASEDELRTLARARLAEAAPAPLTWRSSLATGSPSTTSCACCGWPASSRTMSLCLERMSCHPSSRVALTTTSRSFATR